jgi:hypothetical protein
MEWIPVDSPEAFHPGSERLRNDKHGPPVVSDIDRARAVAVLLVRAQLAAADSETASSENEGETTPAVNQPDDLERGR